MISLSMLLSGKETLLKEVENIRVSEDGQVRDHLDLQVESVV